MMTIEYDPENGQWMGDAYAIETANSIASMSDYDWKAYQNITIRSSNSLLFMALRCAVAEDRLDHTRFQFKFGDHIFQANEYGAINPWPIGFCDADADLAERTTLAATKKRMAKRKSHEEYMLRTEGGAGWGEDNE